MFNIVKYCQHEKAGRFNVMHMYAAPRASFYKGTPILPQNSNLPICFQPKQKLHTEHSKFCTFM